MKLETRFQKTHRSAATLLSLWPAPPRKCLAGRLLITAAPTGAAQRLASWLKFHATPVRDQVEDVKVGGAGPRGGGGAEPGGNTNHRPATIELNQHTLTEFNSHGGEGARRPEGCNTS